MASTNNTLAYLRREYPRWNTDTVRTLKEMARRGESYGVQAIITVLDPDAPWHEIANIAAENGHGEVIDVIRSVALLNLDTLGAYAREGGHYQLSEEIAGPVERYDPPTFTQVYDEDFRPSEPMPGTGIRLPTERDDFLREFGGTAPEQEAHFDITEDFRLYPPIRKEMAPDFPYRLEGLGNKGRGQPPGYEFDEIGDFPEYAEDELSALEFPVRYPGMPGFQGQLRYDPDGREPDWFPSF